MRNSRNRLILVAGVFLIFVIGFSAQPVSADTIITQQPGLGVGWLARTSGWGIGHWYYADQVTGNTYAGVHTWGYAYSEAYVAMKFWLPTGTHDILYSTTYKIKYLKMDVFLWGACNAQFRLGLTDTNWNYIGGEFYTMSFHCDAYNPHYEGYMTEAAIMQWYQNDVVGGRYIYLTAGVWTDASAGARVCGSGNDPRMGAQVYELSVQILD